MSEDCTGEYLPHLPEDPGYSQHGLTTTGTVTLLPAQQSGYIGLQDIH